MNAVIYAKYYNSGNRDELSIEEQIKKCEEFARENGYRITYVYEDGTGQRAEFKHMLEDSENQEFQYVIVSSFDRFAINNYDSAIYKHQLKQDGIKVISVQEKNTSEILTENILENFIEYYTNKLAPKIN